MVLIVPKLPDQTHITFLHDTAGWIVLFAVVLVYVEIMLWRRIRNRRQSAYETHEHMDSHHPHVWQSVARHRIAALVSVRRRRPTVTPVT